MNEWDITNKASVWAAGGMGMLYVVQKMMSFWKKENAGQAGDDTTIKQFKALQDSIASMKEDHAKDMRQMRDDNAALRAEVSQVRSEQAIQHQTISQQHQTINKQQIRLTRLQVLSIRLAALVESIGGVIPASERSEINDLVEDSRRDNT